MPAKEDIRREVLEQRKRLTAGQRMHDSVLVCERLWDLAAFQRARMVAVYLALEGEADPQDCLARCREQGMRVCVPAWSAATRRYALALLRRGEPLAKGPMHVPQPARPEWVPTTMLDVVVTPGLSFDTFGNRIGFGCGHYDRLLNRCDMACTRIGVAFDWQLRRRLPAAAHDVKMHWVVTDTRTLRCG